VDQVLPLKDVGPHLMEYLRTTVGQALSRV